MGFSSILDISSFFIGMIINLIFVALMCYYFKRKYDYLEVAQNEQAKILYQLIHKPSTCPVPCMDFSRDPLTQLKHPEPDSDSESESDDESVESTQNDFVSNEIKDISDLSQLNVEEVKMVELDVTVEEVKMDEPLDITLNVEESGNAYSKMSMKQLKDLLSSKGIKPKNNIRKDELIEILSKEIS
jgi:hypothetical protein